MYGANGIALTVLGAGEVSTREAMVLSQVKFKRTRENSFAAEGPGAKNTSDTAVIGLRAPWENPSLQQETVNSLLSC